MEGICPRCKKLKKLTHYLPDDKKRKKDGKVCSACAQARKVEILPFFKVKKVIDTHKNIAKEGDYGLDCVLKRYQWQGCKCAYCRTFLNEAFTLDHVVPRKASGKNLLFNILIICHDCNSSKGDLELKYWLDKKGYGLTPLIKTFVKGAYDGHDLNHDHF